MEQATKGRSTRQKMAIRSTIDSAKRPLTTLEVLEGARELVPALSIATVYRSIKSLLQEGSIHPVPLPGDNPRYESTHAASTHHHHFQCTSCQRVFDVHDCPGDLERMAPEGFTVERHELTIYGRCADCAGAARQNARATAASATKRDAARSKAPTKARQRREGSDTAKAGKSTRTVHKHSH